MARPLRIEYAGALYHVTSRGDRQQAIFLNDGDRHAWLRILDTVCARFRWNIHAFCLMGNHFHMVVETPQANLGRGMRQLNGEYTQRFNFRNATVGHLFQGRYKAILVQRQTYLLELSRYVVLNPVRAGIVATPNGWPWSSYAMTCSDAPAPAWLTTDWLLSQFGEQRSEAVRQYRRFVADGRGLPSPMIRLRHQLVLGDDEFVDKLGAGQMLIDRIENTRAQRQGAVPSLHEYHSGCEHRSDRMARAYLDGAYTMAEIAAQFSVHYQTVSRAVRTMEAARRSNASPP